MRPVAFSRRTLLRSVAALPLAPWRTAQQDRDPRVDGQALRERIEQLSTFGRPAGGTFADGVSRIAYSDADVEGRRYVMALMRAAGPRAAHRSGRQHLRAARRQRPVAPADPVRLAHRLGPERRQLRRRSRIARPRSARSKRSTPRGVAHAASARDGRLGARGRLRLRPRPRLQPHRRRRDQAARTWTRSGTACAARDAIRKIGGDPDRILDARRPKGSHHCYLELHIEQGGTLERAGIPVGVVEGIVAIDRYDAVDHRLRQPRRHDADGRAARRAARGGAPDDRRARRRHARAGPAGRHRRAHRGHAELAERHSRARRACRSSCATCRPQKLVAMMDDIRARAREIARRHADDDRRSRRSMHGRAGRGDAGGAARDRARRRLAGAGTRRGCRAAPATTRR